MDAGRIAGLNPQKIVNEPTVAAFAAATFIDGLRGTEDKAKPPEPKNTTASVVVDIGGGTSDFSFMQILNGSYYKVVTTDGNKTLGGRDIDIRLAEKMAELFQKRVSDPGIDLNSPEFRQNLRIECEKAKTALSDRDNYTLRVNINVANQGNITLEHVLTRHDFEDYISDILDAMIKPLGSLLSRADETKGNVEDLYLVGGTVQIPRLRQLLQEYFPNVTSNSTYAKDPVQVLRIE
jgi:molecular chaperone DnaK (HSP70)